MEHPQMNPTPTPNSDPLGPKLDGRAALERSLEKLDSPSPQPVDIARLRELLAKATPGHWFEHWFRSGIPASKADAKFIAAIRNEAPALLDEVTELRARVSSEVSIADALADQLHEDKPALAALVAERDRARKDADSNAANGMKAIEALERMTKENNGLLSERDKLREEVEMARSANLGMHDESNILKASLASIRNATQVERFATTPIICARIKTIISERDSLRQQNEQLLKEIEELKKKK